MNSKNTDTEDTLNREASDEKRGNRRMELRRRQICDASAQLFAQHGYLSTTLEMIADELGYSKPSLYHYVRSKEEVIDLLRVRLIQKLWDQVETNIPEKLPVCERLRLLIHTHIDVICNLPESRVLLDFIPTAKSQPEVIAARQEHMDFVVDLIQEGMNQGSFKVKDARISALLLLTMLNNFTKWYSPSGPLTPKQIAEKIAEIFIGGLMNPCVNQG